MFALVEGHNTSVEASFKHHSVDVFKGVLRDSHLCGFWAMNAIDSVYERYIQVILPERTIRSRALAAYATNIDAIVK